MNEPIRLSVLLSGTAGKPEEQSVLFALISLGILEGLAQGLLSATEAVRIFFNADNCLFVRKRIRNQAAEKIMSHGVQLPDVFDALPPEEAYREFRRELSVLRSLRLELLEARRPSPDRSVQAAHATGR